MSREILKPIGLKRGDCLGVFTPSSPAYSANEGLFVNGLRNLERAGFKVKEGVLTQQRGNQGYRSGTAEERALEFMTLITDLEVKGLIATIGGNNSSSLIPYLDFELIRKTRKVICGFSDVTSLHAAILQRSGLRTFYGPSVMCWFGDWPDGDPESLQWFLEATMLHTSGERPVIAPQHWSNHRRRWDNEDWKNTPREWQANQGWSVLNPGTVEAPILAMNLNTLVSSAGTDYWPDLHGKILLIEDMDAPQSRNERLFRHLFHIGVFDIIAGLILGKPENYNQEAGPIAYEELFMEVVGPRNYPIIGNFDCGHTLPMITIPQLCPVRLIAKGSQVDFRFLESTID